MNTSVTKLLNKIRGFRLTPRQVLGLAALLAPISYLVGFSMLSPALVWGALGMLIGIPVGLAYAAFNPTPAAPATVYSHGMEQSILEQLKAELSQNLALFEARKGNMNMFARIEYLTGFWESIKASGRLYVMQDSKLLGTIGAAYFWLHQATHIETLAYEAKYSADVTAGPAAAQQLVGEARLLDGQLENALTQAISAIDAALAS